MADGVDFRGGLLIVVGEQRALIEILQQKVADLTAALEELQEKLDTAVSSVPS